MEPDRRKALRFDVDSGALLTRHDVPDTPVATARLYAELGVDVLLVDSVSRGRPAGTGRTVDNVAAAITSTPYGVDVISGVEEPVGRKDPARVRAFLAAVRC